MKAMNPMLKNVLCILVFLGVLNGFSLSVSAEVQNAEFHLISQINTYVYNYHGQTVDEILRNNSQNVSNKKLKQELWLSMMYDTDLFYNLFTEQDYENSIKVIIQLEKSNYKKPKMLLYKALYLKSKGEWDIALQIIDKSIEMLEVESCQLSDKVFYLAIAKFEKGIMTADQKLIIQSIDLFMPVLDKNLNNIVYLTFMLDLLRFVDVPKTLYEEYKAKSIIYKKQLEKIHKELNLINFENLLNIKEKRDQHIYETVMEPLTNEILSRWKVPPEDRRGFVNLLYYFQINKNREIINIKLIAEDNATKNLQVNSYESIENAIIANLLEGYKLDTIGVLFTFSSE